MKYDFDKQIERKGTYCYKWGKNVLKNDDTIPMMVADMDLPSPDSVVKAMHDVADHRMYGYTTFDGVPEYALSLCDWFKKRHDWEIAPDEVIPSYGTFGALEHAVRMTTDKGDGVIVMPPVYGHFASALTNEWERKAVLNHLIKDENGYYTIDFEDLERKCKDPDTKALIFCSPANPVGRVWEYEEMRKVYEICSANDVFIISDEVHCDHLRNGVKHIPFLKVCDDKGKAMVLVGVNKTFNMAGLALSNAIIQSKELKSRFLKGYSYPAPTSFAIAGHIAAYTEGHDWMDQICEYIEGNIDWAIDFFKKQMPKVKICKPEGTYIMWLDFSQLGLSDEEIHKRIYTDANVILQDGTVHDPDNGQCFQRMCIPCPRPLLKKACERIAKAFEDVK